MPKIVGPPPITNLDGLMDIFTHPEKYAKYLEELKQLHLAIEATLDIANTQEAAQALMAQAEMKRREADEYDQNKSREIQQRLDAAVERERQLGIQQATNQAQHESQLSAHRQSEQQLAAREKSIAEQEKAVSLRESEVAKREADVLVRMRAVQEREEKAKKAQATLTALVNN